MNDEVQQIKEKLDIVEVMSSYLTLKKAGVNMKTNCPFHHEKTPSMMVSAERQTFKCFGCGEGGDVFTFIEKIEGVDFYNALKILADKAGVKLSHDRVKYGEKEYKSDHKTKMFEINNWAKQLYHKILMDHPKADHARHYLLERGLTDEMMREFELGYAPDSWDLLTKFLKNKGYSVEEIVQAGVAIKNDRGDCYDRFRGRIMFPIGNTMGLTVAFTSRILKDDDKQAKYINSSESPIYTKGKTIYGLDKAKMAIKEADMAIFVEGNMDVITCHQAGFRNVVATSGTAITADQIKILNRYASEVAFCFDSDTAGEAAMKKAVRIALENDVNCKIIAMPQPFKDPDEAIKSDPKNWIKAVKESKPALEYWIDLLVRKNPDLSVLVRKNIAKEILPVLKIIASEIEKEYYIKYLSKKLFVSEQTIQNSLAKTKAAAPAKDAAEVSAKSEEETVAEKIAGLLWHEPKFIQLAEARLDDFDVAKLPKFCVMIRSRVIDKDKVPADETNELNQHELLALGNTDPEDPDSIVAEFKYLIARHQSEKQNMIKEEYAQKMRIAEESGDKEALKKLLSEFSSLIK